MVFDKNSPTPSPAVTETQIHYQPTLLPPLDSWDERFISRVALSKVANQSQEEIANELLLQWLEYYKSHENDNDYKIENYNIISITLEESNNPSYSIVATAFFEVKPVQLQSVWIVGGGTVMNGDWLRIKSTFGIFQDGEYFRLRSLPGWGT
jgi:hypothetical protein